MDSERKKKKVKAKLAVIKAIKPLKKSRRGRRTTRFSNLPHEIVGSKILTKVPMTSLGAVRSTCKLWKALSREWIVGYAAARHQFLGFMTLNSKVFSLRCGLFKDKDDLGLVDLSVKQVDTLNHVDISKVIHCDGLLLCIGANSAWHKLWNPYLDQIKWVRPGTKPHIRDRYALGYDNNRNHKILRLIHNTRGYTNLVLGYEIYDLSSDTWRVLDITAEGGIEFHQRGVSLKGNTYFFAQDLDPELFDLSQEDDIEDFLVCFDFTTERFGPRLPLPFHSILEDRVTLSCVREEQLAVLHQQQDHIGIMEVWVSTKIEPNSVSWSKFLEVDMTPLTGFQFSYAAASFFIDEENKVVVVFNVEESEEPNNAAFIIGDDGYFKSVPLGKAKHARDPDEWDFVDPLVCSSSYYPSLVQINN